VKTFVARCSFTDRRQGPGTGRTLEVQATNTAGAVGKAARQFWAKLGRKERWDATRSGLCVTVTQRRLIDAALD
jgi:hypothetical protein